MIWHKKKNNPNQIFEKIEQAVQDDLAMFLEFGEEYYSLEELEQMHSDWEQEFNMTDKLRGRFVMLCLSSLMLIPVAGGLVMIGFAEYLPILIVSFPIFFLFGLAGFIALYYRYGKLDYQEGVGRKLKFAIHIKRKKLGLSKGFES